MAYVFMNRQMNKETWYLFTVESYSVIKKDKPIFYEVDTPWDQNETHKLKYHIIPLKWETQIINLDQNKSHAIGTRETDHFKMEKGPWNGEK